MIVSPDGFIIIDAPSLSERTTIRLGGNAIAEVRISSLDSLDVLPDLLDCLGGRISIVGEGSNIIAADGELPLLLLSLAQMDAPRVVKEEGDAVWLEADAGMRLPALLSHAAGLGLSGLEGLCGIPGNVGGALRMNAGSFGVEMSQLTCAVRLFSPLLGLVDRTAEEFTFGYRHCSLQGHPDWFLVCAVTLKLSKGDKNAIREKMRDIYQRKQQSQPVTAWSAGCVFKNPSPEAPAGRLLEEAGMRGMKLGGMSFSSVHANFLVNDGTGVFEEAAALINMARDKVRAASGHSLELEVKLWP